MKKIKNHFLIIIITLIIIIGIIYKIRFTNQVETVIKIKTENTILLVVDSEYKVTNYKKLDSNSSDISTFKNKKLEKVIDLILKNSIEENYINEKNKNITFQFITNSEKRIKKYENKIVDILEKYKQKNNIEIFMVKEVASEEDLDKYSNELTDKTIAASKEEALHLAILAYNKVNGYFISNNISTSSPKTDQDVDLLNIELEGTKLNEKSYYYVQNKKLYMYVDLSLYKKSNRTVKSIYGFYFDGSTENYRETEVKSYIYND